MIWLERFAEPLQYGLLTDRIMDITRGSRRELTNEDRRVLSLYESLIRLAEEGATQAQTGILRENAVEAVSAHLMLLFSLHNFGFDVSPQNCLAEIESALQSNTISSVGLEKSRELARAIRKSCIYIIGRELAK
jgi:hypothetical protein